MTLNSDVLLERMMTLHPKLMDLTLDRVWKLLDALGNPQDKLPPVIHIAGTNGKGSTQAMIRAGLEGAGLTAHAYTSPHLARFHERIVLAGELISEPHLTKVLDECYDANGGEEITYFEITTCAALLAMSRTPADYTLLEVGLGGRLDATNVISKPALTVITPVSFDHPQFLGNTVGEIALEKAGILKNGVTSIITRQPEEALDVIEKRAEEISAPLLIQGRDWDSFEERGRLVYQDERGLLDLPPPALMGAHQFQNAGTALVAMRHLRINEASYEAVPTKVTWPARMQRLKEGPLLNAAPETEFWLDGGHNAACGEALAETLTRLPKRETHLICGMMNTKDVQGYMRPLLPHVTHLHAVSIPGETNTLLAKETAAAAQAVGIVANEAQSVEAALGEITKQHPKARVLICGSLYLAGHILREHN